MTQKQGFRKENDLVNTLFERTDENIRVHPLGSSGNHKAPSGDVLVRTPVKDHSIELKSRNCDVGERRQVLTPEDADQLLKCRNKYTDVWLAVLFDHRELMVTRGRFVTIDDPVEAFVEGVPPCFDPNVTKSGNLTVRKPGKDVWNTAQSGDDPADVLLRELDIQDVYITET